MQNRIIEACLVIVVCATTLHARKMPYPHHKRHSEVDAGYRFSFLLYKELAKSAENFIFSPYSISAATAMVMLGTRGKTEMELKSFLQDNASTFDRKAFHLTYKTARELIANTSKEVTLSVANRIFPDQSFKLYPRYSEQSELYYGSTVQPLNYSTNANRARVIINRWARSNTNGIIKNLLPPRSVDSTTRVVLANAIYFKGTWVTQFNPRKTVEDDFYVNKRTTLRTNFMVNKAKYKYASSADFSLIELPYKGHHVSMVIVLPKERYGLDALEKKALDGEVLSFIHNRGFPREVNVWLPKFKMDYETGLTDTFSRLGVKSLFQPTADFSGMSGSKGMFISEIRHKAFIEVNEEGTEAAAATAFAGMRSFSFGTKTFNCDHPFLFYILHKPTNTILFLGRYTTPEK